MADAILVEGLRFAHAPTLPGVPAPWVLDGIDLHVDTGEWLAVMGASDVGKTTLCLLLAGLAPHLTGGNQEGRIVVDGRDTRDHPPPALAGTILRSRPKSPGAWRIWACRCPKSGPGWTKFWSSSNSTTSANAPL
jgi:energy-coupling factor transporter ATP-binding protein EcfA2